jgi:SAM-dependent methyltransferase
MSVATKRRKAQAQQNGKLAQLPSPPSAPLRLDFGCGPHKRDGFVGVDRIAFAGVDQVVDLTKAPWPWADNSVSEAHASHFIEHLTAIERARFVNELYRVLVPDGKCQVIVPHWASCRAYGDPTHQWPPVSEFWFFYLNRDWRKLNAPHTDAEVWEYGFNCNLTASWGYSMRADLAVRNQEYQQFAMGNYKEACEDIVATLQAVK